MNKIFISYKREDVIGVSISLFDRLTKEFGKDNVFKDLDSIPIGSDFRKELSDAINNSDIVIALIGKQFTSIKDESGNIRIFNPNDFVHIELKKAIDLGKIIIPLLIDTQMPKQNDLPEALVPLIYYNSLELRTSKWNSDIEDFVKKLKKIPDNGSKRKNNFKATKNAVFGLSMVLIIVICVFGWLYFKKTENISSSIQISKIKQIILNENFTQAKNIIDSLLQINPQNDSIIALKQQLHYQSIWSGIWNQKQGNGFQGKLILKTDGLKISGNFINSNQSQNFDYRNKIEGQIKNNGTAITGKWENSTSQKGNFDFKLQNDNNSFTGSDGINNWDGIKVQDIELQKYFNDKFVVKSITDRLHVIILSTADFSIALKQTNDLIKQGFKNSKILISNSYGVSIDDFDNKQAAIDNANELKSKNYTDAFPSKH